MSLLTVIKRLSGKHGTIGQEGVVSTITVTPKSDLSHAFIGLVEEFGEGCTHGVDGQVVGVC